MERAELIKFKDHSNIVRLGIILPDGSIICGCCGEIYSPDEVGLLDAGAIIEPIKNSLMEWVEIV